MDYKLKDSGERQTFESGAQRDTASGKGRYDLLSPLALRRLAIVMEKGAEKYSPRNWEKGMPLSRFVDSALRHLFQYLEGRSDEDHAAQALWNIHGLIHTEEMIERGFFPSDLIDLPRYFLTRIDRKDVCDHTGPWPPRPGSVIPIPRAIFGKGPKAIQEFLDASKRVSAVYLEEDSD